MSVENLRVDEPSSKGWANLYMNNLTVYNDLNVGGRMFGSDGQPVTVVPEFGQPGIYSRDLEDEAPTFRTLIKQDIHPVLDAVGTLKSQSNGAGGFQLSIQGIEGFSSYQQNGLNMVPPNPARTKFTINNTSLNWSRTSGYDEATGIYTVPKTGIYMTNFRAVHRNDTAIAAGTNELVQFSVGAPGGGGFLGSDWVISRSGYLANQPVTISGVITRRFTQGSPIAWAWVPMSVGIQTLIFTYEMLYLGD